MADISKINGVPIANIEKLDAVLAANIAKVNGLVFSTAAAFLLDTYTGAAAGYSTRRLASSATVLMRVRRETAGGTGDDDEADVAYDSNNELSLDSAISNASALVTATTLGQFLNVGTVNGTTYTNPDSLTVTASCFTDTWYDQSGNANHAEQTAQGSQPQIHSGTVNTDLITENGKPAVSFDGTNDEFDISYSGLNINNLSVATVWQDAVGGGSDRMHFTLNSGSNQWYWHYVQAGVDRFYYAGDTAMNFGTTDTNQHLSLLIAGSTSGAARFYRDGVEASTTATLVSDVVNTAEQKLGNFYTGNFWWDGTTQEFIVWGADQFNNRTAIESDINSNYLIYQPTDAPTSGLLATYTGAAAAYSVRQLSDKAVIALRIRRDSDDEETNIGWDANGDLDTTAISDFCSTANGYVTRWWDQSTNGNHADQPVGGTGSNAFQPQIYNGTAVITENGKAALQGGSGVYLTQPSAVSVPDDLTLLAVADTSNLTATQLIVAVDTDTCATDTQIFTDSNGSRVNGRSSTCGFVHSTKSGNSSLFIGVLDYTNDSLTARYDGVAQSAVSGLTESPNSIDWNVGANVSGTSNNLGTYQEVIIWLTAQSPTNATNIESNVMTYFSIT